MSRLTATLVGLFLAGPALADEAIFPATLAGHAVIPAMTLIATPADAPADARLSGKFAGGPARNDVPGSVPGDTGPLHGKRRTGIAFPFDGQPLQGLSGFAMDRTPDGMMISLTDNGFGAKLNSPDALLFFHKLMADFDTGAVTVAQTVFLRDPDRVVPFRIAYEGTAERYLTGSDFDLESVQLIGDTLWFGDEFGPFILSAMLDGTITGVYPTMLDGAALKGPDTPGVIPPAAAGKDFRAQRSGGYEGLALQPGTGLLWGMLEKPLFEADGTAGTALTVLAFDPAAKAFTGQGFRFPLAEGATAIGDFNFIDATRALVIERDNGEGDPSLACADPKAPTPDCFPLPARLKRIVLIDTASVDGSGMVRRIGHIDLMNIADPDGKGRLETAATRDLEGIYTLPFFTIENVAMVDDSHIIVAVDNNLPFSSGRQLDKAADNEFVLLSVPELLAAR